MFRFFAALVGALAIAAPAYAITPFPDGFRSEEIATNGTTLHVRVGGHGPAVVMLHGFGDTGDMWAPVAAALARDHTVVVPDLRGMGLSAHPDDGYTKKNEAADIAGVMDALNIKTADLVTHDIGNMVGYALAAGYPGRITKWVVIDAPLPGVGNWAAQLSNPKSWHFNFYGPDEERLVAGRERIYLDRFWNELSADPSVIDEATREHYAELYARAACDARRLRAVQGVSAGRRRQPGVPGRGQADNAGAGARRREILRRRDGRPNSDLSPATSRAELSRIQATGSWRKTRRRRQR